MEILCSAGEISPRGGAAEHPKMAQRDVHESSLILARKRFNCSGSRAGISFRSGLGEGSSAIEDTGVIFSRGHDDARSQTAEHPAVQRYEIDHACVAAPSARTRSPL